MNIVFKSLLINLFEQISVTCLYNVAFNNNMSFIYLKAFQKLGGVGDYQKRTVCKFAVFGNSFCNYADGIYIKTRVCFVKNCKGWLEHKQLKDFCLFALST